MNEGNGPRFLQAVAWPALILLGLLVATSVSVVVVAFLLPVEYGKLLGETRALTRLVAIVVIVPLIGVLAILDKIEGAATIAALSAIAGYILGQPS